MFGTYRFNHETNEQEHVTLSRADGMEARGYTRTACQWCRAQKVITMWRRAQTIHLHALTCAKVEMQWRAEWLSAVSCDVQEVHL